MVTHGALVYESSEEYLLEEAVLCVVVKNVVEVHGRVGSLVGYVMVDFYERCCGYCQALAPEYAATTTKLKGDEVMLAKDSCIF
ncbi:Thioredoxin domain-containing protein [Cynara cardunculus var. scolymus]|uniref:Thioredoxin domain-containing protein n=1 Tax=Cynara cardunculus var. scolymus TaxID=59895 RepID=A0A103YC63_CYNCS|nr:Thioredoxin domain-containing protein [Cynara cardunculus var. scolymus]